MAITNAMCTSFKQELLQGQHNFTASTGHTFKLALYTSSATLDATTTDYSATNEVSGTGYSASSRWSLSGSIASATCTAAAIQCARLSNCAACSGSVCLELPCWIQVDPLAPSIPAVVSPTQSASSPPPSGLGALSSKIALPRPPRLPHLPQPSCAAFHDPVARKVPKRLAECETP